MTHPVEHHYRKRYESRTEGSWRHCARPEATHIVIEFKDGPYTPSVTIKVTETDIGREIADAEAEAVERLLELAFNRGDKAARADIRRALGVTDPRP